MKLNHRYVVWYVGANGTPDRIEREADDIDTGDGVLTGYAFDRNGGVSSDGGSYCWDLWCYAPGQWLRVERLPEEVEVGEQACVCSERSKGEPYFCRACGRT